MVTHRKTPQGHRDPGDLDRDTQTLGISMGTFRDLGTSMKAHRHPGYLHGDIQRDPTQRPWGPPWGTSRDPGDTQKPLGPPWDHTVLL